MAQGDGCESGDVGRAEVRSGVSVPVISVLLPTMQPWPEISSALAAVLAQTAAPLFEVLVLDGHGDALPAPPEDPSVRWLRLPGADTFELRAAGIAAARGTIVAVSEDHCIARPGWLAAIAAAHGAGPVPAVLGVVANHPDSAMTAMDRANFILTFAGQNSHRLDTGRRRLPVPTNLSFKRAALPSPRPGELEYRWIARLSAAGTLGVSRSIILQHRQRWGRATLAVHLASGRSFGASVREAPWRHRLHWWAGLPLLPARLARLVTPDLLSGAGGARPTVADALCLGLLVLVNVCGQVLGAVAGPGGSRRRL
jgi:hypothetical protein